MRCSWSERELRKAVKRARSIRQVISFLGLVPAGGNYVQVQKYIKKYGIPTSHFLGMGWRKGTHCAVVEGAPLHDILVRNSSYQSFKLKRRLFAAGLKRPRCEECGWAKRSDDGRLPLELDHANGDSSDNRIENLRVLCPNCHSLKPTHRGRNQKCRQKPG